ncbi:nicotianamine synthase family protein [Burkholderia orbicola]|uniref:nicotianamine synthase family protein n=1 Tax=Burkholderia orbicola TaxID=2978683 RepID=UPI003AF8C34B
MSVCIDEMEVLHQLESELRLLTAYAKETDGCYEILKRKIDELSGFITAESNWFTWTPAQDDGELSRLTRSVRDTAVIALCNLEKYLCQKVLRDGTDLGSYLDSLTLSVRTEIARSGITDQARLLFIGSGSFPTSAMLIARETRAQLCCIDIDDDANLLGSQIANRQGLGGLIEFTSAPIATLPFARRATHFMVASLVETKAAVLDQIRMVMDDRAKVLVRYGTGIKELFNYSFDLASLRDWTVVGPPIIHPVFDTVILEKPHHA